MKPILSLLLPLLLLSGPSVFAQQATIRVGDTIEMRLTGVPGEDSAAVNSTQVVDDSGMLNITHLGKVKVSGLTPSAAQTLIENQFKNAKIYTKPTVVVTVGSGQRLVNVTGEVRSPGRQNYTPDLTLMTAIAGASGFTDFADKKKIKLTRGGKVQVIDYTKIAVDPSKDIKVLPGDLIYVPQAGPFG